MWRQFFSNRKTSSKLTSSCFGLLLAVISASGALACQGSSVLLDEKFTAPDSSWDKPDDRLSYGPSGAVLKPPPGEAYYTYNMNYTSDGVDLCATAIWPSDIKPTTGDGTVAILFWAKDYPNRYVAGI